MEFSTLVACLAATSLLENAPQDVLESCASQGQQLSLLPGDTLIRAGEHKHSLFIVLQGHVQVTLAGSTAHHDALAELGEGSVLGEIQVVTGQASTADVIATTPCLALELNRELLRTVSDRFSAFDARLTLLASARLRSVTFRRAVDALLGGADAARVDDLVRSAVEVELDRDDYLFRQGDAPDAWYVLTSGRLGVFAESPDGPKRVADHMPGAVVGEMALISGGLRTASIRAERKSTLARLSRDDFERFADAHPPFARRLMGIFVERVSRPAASNKHRTAQVLVLLKAATSPVLDIALQQLGEALSPAGSVALLNRLGFESALGRTLDGHAHLAENHPVWNRFDVWLEEAQRHHAIVVLDAGDADDLWARECLLHADLCLWVAEPVPENTTQPPQALIARLHAAQVLARHDAQSLPWSLLLVHPPSTARPQNTRAWLDGAPFARHFHVRIDDTASMARAARLLTGHGIGLALSGGGARGLAHIGVLQAFVEANVPIDWIGGTSMGAIQAGMFAMGLSIAEIAELNRQVIAAKPFQEYTLPFIALVASRRRDQGIALSFGDIQIEDLWIPFLAVSTDLHAARAHVHERGSLGLAAGASSSLPGVLVPLLDGQRILVDGGIVNNMPADLVKARCGGTVFASNVAPRADLVAPENGFPSVWSLVWRRLLPWSQRIQTPRLGDILIRTMTVGGADHMETVLQDVDVLIEPDVRSFGMLQFHAMPQLIERGYLKAQGCLQPYPVVAKQEH